METTVKERLIRYLKHKRIGQNKFENMAGLSNGYISNLKYAPGADKLLKILNAAPDLNKIWLLTGEGEMFNTQEPEAVQLHTAETEEYGTSKAGIKYRQLANGQIQMVIPVLPIRSLASPDDEYADYSKLIEDEDESAVVHVNVEHMHHGMYYAFRVKGDSMDDGSRGSFEEGDIVVVRHLDRDLWLPHLRINQWRFWVIVFGNNVRLKEITEQDEETGDITCHSLNPSPEYTDFTLHLDSVNHLFNVVQKIPKPTLY